MGFTQARKWRRREEEEFQAKGKAEMKQLVLFWLLKAVGSFPWAPVYLQKPVLGSLKEV